VSGLYILNLETDSTWLVVEGWASSPDWRPDGERIAWAPITEEGSQIWVMRADGTDKQKLVDRGREPAWGLNSDRIVFSKPASERDNTALWTIRRDGSNLQQLTDPSRNPLN